MKNTQGLLKYLSRQLDHDAYDLNYLAPPTMDSLLLLSTLTEKIVGLDLNFRVLTCVSTKGG